MQVQPERRVLPVLLPVLHRIWQEDCDSIGKPDICLRCMRGSLPSHLFSRVETGLFCKQSHIFFVRNRHVGHVSETKTFVVFSLELYVAFVWFQKREIDNFCSIFFTRLTTWVCHFFSGEIGK